jgi:glycosyltransferase involved in cell wall biosynthesis
MNIVFLNPIGSIGGAERVLIDVVSALTKSPEGHRVTVILLTEGPLDAAIKDAGASVVVLPLPAGISGIGDSQMIGGNRLLGALRLCFRLLAKSGGLATFAFRLRGVIQRCKPDILYSNGLKTHLLSAIVKPLNAKLVWHLHDFYGARPAVASVIRSAARRIDHGVAISHAIEKDMHGLLPQIPITVIYNAVDESKFIPPNDYCDASRLDRLSALAANDEAVIRVGMIATYANWKGHRTFIEAFAMAASKVPHALRGYLIGGPIYSTSGSQVTETELRKWILDYGLEDRIGLIPFQKEIAEVYQMLDIVVHASTRPEPFGLTIVEAMSCGRPVIVSDAGGAKELFTSGIDGLAHAPGNAVQLADAIVRLANDSELRQSLGKQARLNSCVRFSKARFSDEMNQLIEHLKP